MTNFHRTLSTHFRTFLGAGFTVDDIREPTPTEEQAERYPVVSDNLRVPDFIIYVLRKTLIAETWHLLIARRRRVTMLFQDAHKSNYVGLCGLRLDG